MMTKNLLKVGMLASLVTAMAAPAIMPNIVFAQADIRQEGRRTDRRENRQQDCQMNRQQDRRENRRADRGGRYGLSSHTNGVRTFILTPFCYS